MITDTKSENRFPWVIILLLIILIVIGIFEIAEINKQNNLACKELGFKSMDSIMGISYCESYKGDLYYVKIDCNWIVPQVFIKDCKAKEISVGGVRVK